jgi:hypothetical protein
MPPTPYLPKLSVVHTSCSNIIEGATNSQCQTDPSSSWLVNQIHKTFLKQYAKHAAEAGSTLEEALPGEGACIYLTARIPKITMASAAICTRLRLGISDQMLPSEANIQRERERGWFQ